MNLTSQTKVAEVEHEIGVDWISLSDACNVLILRDLTFQLLIYDIRSQVKTVLLAKSGFVQLIEHTNVLVAQSNDEIYVWYNIESDNDALESTIIPVKVCAETAIFTQIFVLLRKSCFGTLFRAK